MKNLAISSLVICRFCLPTNLFIDFFEEVMADCLAELVLIHEFRGDLLVMLHPVNEEALQNLAENVSEFSIVLASAAWRRLPSATASSRIDSKNSWSPGLNSVPNRSLRISIWYIQGNGLSVFLPGYIHCRMFRSAPATCTVFLSTDASGCYYSTFYPWIEFRDFRY